jgi:propionyl-CoA synthetase
MKKYDTSSLRYLFLAGEPLGRAHGALGVRCARLPDRGQLLADGDRVADPHGLSRRREDEAQARLAVLPRVRLQHQARSTRRRAPRSGPNEKGVLCIVPPLPPGSMTTVWGDDERYVDTYYKSFDDEMVYTTFDWATRDAEGYYFVPGRTDDVINVAGHRLGTREIEEAVQAHPNVAEVAVRGRGRSREGPGSDRVRGR